MWRAALLRDTETYVYGEGGAGAKEMVMRGAKDLFYTG